MWDLQCYKVIDAGIGASLVTGDGCRAVWSPSGEALYELDDTDAGEGHVPLPRVDSSQEEAKKVGLLSTGLGPKVSIMGMWVLQCIPSNVGWHS